MDSTNVLVRNSFSLSTSFSFSLLFLFGCSEKHLKLNKFYTASQSIVTPFPTCHYSAKIFNGFCFLNYWYVIFVTVILRTVFVLFCFVLFFLFLFGCEENENNGAFTLERSYRNLLLALLEILCLFFSVTKQTSKILMHVDCD